MIDSVSIRATVVAATLFTISCGSLHDSAYLQVHDTNDPDRIREFLAEHADAYLTENCTDAQTDGSASCSQTIARLDGLSARLDELLWRDTVIDDTLESYATYINTRRIPGVHRRDAGLRYDQLLMENVSASPSIQNCWVYETSCLLCEESEVVQAVECGLRVQQLSGVIEGRSVDAFLARCSDAESDLHAFLAIVARGWTETDSLAEFVGNEGLIQQLPTAFQVAAFAWLEEAAANGLSDSESTTIEDLTTFLDTFPDSQAASTIESLRTGLLLRRDEDLFEATEAAGDLNERIQSQQLYLSTCTICVEDAVVFERLTALEAELRERERLETERRLAVFGVHGGYELTYCFEYGDSRTSTIRRCYLLAVEGLSIWTAREFAEDASAQYQLSDACYRYLLVGGEASLLMCLNYEVDQAARAHAVARFCVDHFPRHSAETCYLVLEQHASRCWAGMSPRTADYSARVSSSTDPIYGFSASCSRSPL